jgi:deoxyribonucleoside regulator
MCGWPLNCATYCGERGDVLTKTGRRSSGSDLRQMVRITQLYYRMHLSQEEIGKRLGLSRFQVGRLLARALREDIVRIEIAHPVARLIELEDALVERFGLRAAIVVDVPPSPSEATEQAAREAVAGAAVGYLAELRPSGSIGVSWGRTMLELARQLRPGWTSAAEVVQLNGATSRSAEPTRATEIADRFGATTGASIRLLAAPAIVGSPELRRALEGDPAVGATIEAARAAATAIFALGVLTPTSVLVGSGFLTIRDVADLQAVGAVGDIVGRFLRIDGTAASAELDERTVGLPLADLVSKPVSIGLAAGAGRGPITLAALRGRYINVLVADADTAQWVLDHERS